MGKGLAGTALGFSIAALVLGWIPFFGWLVWIAGLVLAIVAIVKCKTPEDGKSLAIAAIVIMAVSFVVTILLGAIGMLAYFDVMSPSKFLPNRCTIGEGFSCTEYKVTQDGVSIGIANYLGVDAENVSVAINGDCTDQAAVGSIVDGSMTTVKLCAGQQPSTPFRGNLTVTYMKTGDAAESTARGTLVVAQG